MTTDVLGALGRSLGLASPGDVVTVGILRDRFEPGRLTLRPVMLADVDHFKAINDRHGHLVGDEVLVGVARLLEDGLRASDMAVRWGGEEFLMVLRGCDLGEAQRIAENLRQKIATTPLVVNGQRIEVTLSFGVSQFDGGDAIDGTIAQADAALIRAKEGGRNQVWVATA